mmetsp:Transcript_68624/g.143185  ORF Transcript_68624/g.143185 Transcript_68624/m.143185 type:complete len:371 (+) Transcript_68624:152-1264(+)|eukprot:CAMPEP_0181317812 /NCGR_PEP_ID=MMETSP1101-20121128/16669_1 /TAXON_ID=46948 /ORGANISM="Rhodomonas abbreviata, Strain Caron Lab Isolate" /LENGTH=370 /DNA_ID=CAMNT_0023425233 /DNA_START=149 /DNA_END=1261 /DNA_ORIENTATION=-
MGNTEARDGPGAATTNKSYTGVGAAEKLVRLELDIQKERMGKLIGTGGKTIKEIQQRAPTINFRTPGKDDAGGNEYKFVPVILSGRAQDVFKAAVMVDDVATACLAVLAVQIAPRDVPLLQRESIQNLQEEIAVDTLRLPRKQDKPPRVVIEGHLEDVVKAYHHILAEVEKAAKEAHEEREMGKLMAISKVRLGEDEAAGDASEKAAEQGYDGKMQKKSVREPRERQKRPGDVTDEFDVTTKQGAMIVGPKGSTLFKLERDTRAHIFVQIQNGKVRIEGAPPNVNKAKREIERMINSRNESDGKALEDRNMKWEGLTTDGAESSQAVGAFQDVSDGFASGGRSYGFPTMQADVDGADLTAGAARSEQADP